MTDPLYKYIYSFFHKVDIKIFIGYLQSERSALCEYLEEVMTEEKQMEILTQEFGLTEKKAKEIVDDYMPQCCAYCKWLDITGDKEYWCSYRERDEEYVFDINKCRDYAERT